MQGQCVEVYKAYSLHRGCIVLYFILLYCIVLYCIVMYLYIYIALLEVHTNQKRLQCERPKRKRTKRSTWLTSGSCRRFQSACRASVLKYIKLIAFTEVVLYCIVFYFIVLYCIVLYCIYTFIYRFLKCTPIRSASSARDPKRRERKEGRGSPVDHVEGSKAHLGPVIAKARV